MYEPEYLDALNTTSWSWEDLQEREYEDEDNIVDVRYPETYC